jgi:hypothetical protein
VSAFRARFGGNYKYMISKQALEEFKEIWRKENPGKDIDDKTAMDEAVALLTLMDTVYRPIKKEWLEKYKEGVEGENSEDKGRVTS